jgi:hypothetical protein
MSTTPSGPSHGPVSHGPISHSGGPPGDQPGSPGVGASPKAARTRSSSQRSKSSPLNSTAALSIGPPSVSTGSSPATAVDTVAGEPPSSVSVSVASAPALGVVTFPDGVACGGSPAKARANWRPSPAVTSLPSTSPRASPPSAVCTDATMVSSACTGGRSVSPGRSTRSIKQSTIFCPWVRVSSGSASRASTQADRARYNACASGVVHTIVTADRPTVRSGRSEMPRCASARARSRAASRALCLATTCRTRPPNAVGVVTRCRAATQSMSSVSTLARRASSAIGAMYSSRHHRCRSCSSPA